MENISKANAKELATIITLIEATEKPSNKNATVIRNNAVRQLLNVISENDLNVGMVRKAGKYPLNAGDLLESVVKALINKRNKANCSWNNKSDLYICGKPLEIKAHFHNKYTSTSIKTNNNGLCFIWENGEFMVFTTTNEEMLSNSYAENSKGGKLNLKECEEKELFTKSSKHDEIYNTIDYIYTMINQLA